MITLGEYLADPCASLSIPYWKAASISLPEDMAIFHAQNFPGSTEFRSVERYFRLFHDLKAIYGTDAPVSLRTAESSDVDTIVSVINRCYADIQVSTAQIEGYRNSPVFDPELWILALDETTSVCMGCGIADLDKTAGELVLEWIQVLPQYRRWGVGKALVNELLRRGQSKARFSTVSGKLDDPVSPERLYRSCGFAGSDVWYICHK